VQLPVSNQKWSSVSDQCTSISNQWRSASQHAWSRATGLRSHRHYTAPGTAASALRWSCPTHRTTGRLDSLVAIPHTLGNLHICYTPSLRCPRSKTRQLASRRMRPTHAPLPATAPRPDNTRQSPHATKQLPHAARARTAILFYQRTPCHITGKTDISTGRNKRSFSGPHKLYRVDCLTQQRQTPTIYNILQCHTCTPISQMVFLIWILI
jgi:hypothetical protein